MKTKKILADFRICISVPVTPKEHRSNSCNQTSSKTIESTVPNAIFAMTDRSQYLKEK